MIPRYLFALSGEIYRFRWIRRPSVYTLDGRGSRSAASTHVLSKHRGLCVHAEERYWYKQGAGPEWSVLCNQAPITIEGGQSSPWTLAGTTLFQAIRLLARLSFLFLILCPRCVRRKGVCWHRSCLLNHLPVSLVQSVKLCQLSWLRADRFSKFVVVTNAMCFIFSSLV